MRILAIETSCDETSIAVIEGDGERVKPVTFVVRTQIETHQAFGGVVPEVAAREHLAHLLFMFREHVDPKGRDIDVIAVTAGPGLAPALRVGVEVAKTLAWTWQKPLVPVCHLEGHIYASWLTDGAVPQFPALALIVSGGHTELVLMQEHGKFTRLGETIDDAAGEAFDKVAKMLGLGYPGGPAVARLAEQGNPKAFDFPRAMLDKGLDFSFAGVKTSVLYLLREQESRLSDAQFRADVAASFQEAVVDVLLRKTAKALAVHAPVSMVLAGGVAANVELRKRFQALGEEKGVAVFVPALTYALDNAAMIGAAGYFRALRGDTVNPLQLQADSNMDIV